MNSIALKAGFPSYDDVIAELSGVTVPVKVVLEIFNAGTTSYTDSLVDGQCYKVGRELLGFRQTYCTLTNTSWC